MPKVHIVITEANEAGADIAISVDGQPWLDARCGGGEPEDNTFFRDWNWVPHALRDLATKLGADVTFEDKT